KNNFIRVNKYLAEAHNSTKEEIAGKNNFDLYPKEQAQAYWKDDLEVIESGKPKLFIEEKWNTKNGTKWVSTSKIPFKNENNEITGIIGLSFDITNQKLIEEDLKRSKEKLKIITENANDLIYILNEHLEFEYINESVFKRKMGYSNQDLIGKSHVSKTFKKDIPTTHQKLINVFKKRNLDPIKYETREFDKGGNIHWMEINGKPFIDNDGQFKLMLIGRDITGRK
ncbi:MAG: PAS domain-containing protein, partial [Candidatus Lokiarchaeota archaeon]